MICLISQYSWHSLRFCQWRGLVGLGGTSSFLVWSVFFLCSHFDNRLLTLIFAVIQRKYCYQGNELSALAVKLLTRCVIFQPYKDKNLAVTMSNEQVNFSQLKHTKTHQKHFKPSNALTLSSSLIILHLHWPVSSEWWFSLRPCCYHHTALWLCWAVCIAGTDLFKRRVLNNATTLTMHFH